MEDIVSQIMTEIKKRNIGKEEIADSLDVSETCVYYWLNNLRVPTIDNLYMLADFLGYDIVLKERRKE